MIAHFPRCRKIKVSVAFRLHQERVTMNTEQNGQRAVGLDLLKALAITLVVFLHNAQLNPGSVIDNAFMMLCTSAVPVFFMVTGAIQLNRTGSINYRRHLMSKSRASAQGISGIFRR